MHTIIHVESVLGGLAGIYYAAMLSTLPDDLHGLRKTLVVLLVVENFALLFFKFASAIFLSFLASIVGLVILAMIFRRAAKATTPTPYEKSTGVTDVGMQAGPPIPSPDG